MADETVVSTPTPAAPAAPPAPPAEPQETPSDEGAKGAETTIETTEAPKVETLLGAEKKAEEKPADEVKPSEEPKAEEKSVEPEKAPESPVYEPFTLPENVTFDAEKMGEFTKTLSEFETTAKVPHEEMQKLGQQMVDRHIAEMQRYTESLTHAWNKQKTDWKDSFLKDPEFTNRTDTVVNAAIDAIGIYGGNEKQQGEFRKLMEDTGVGNHPAMIRMLSNMMLAKPEPKPLAPPQNASPVRESKISKMYGKKS